REDGWLVGRSSGYVSWSMVPVSPSWIRCASSARIASKGPVTVRLAATPGTLGVSGFLGCCGLGVLLVSWSLFPVYARAWVMPACCGGGGARFHGPRPRAGGAVPPFPGVVCRSGLGESGREYCD